MIIQDRWKSWARNPGMLNFISEIMPCHINALEVEDCGLCLSTIKRTWILVLFVVFLVCVLLKPANRGPGKHSHPMGTRRRSNSLRWRRFLDWGKYKKYDWGKYKKYNNKMQKYNSPRQRRFSEGKNRVKQDLFKIIYTIYG